MYSLDEAGEAVAPPPAHRAGPTAGPPAAAGGAGATGAAQALRPLSSLARLDTCVTVVDASSMLDRLHSLQTLKEQEAARGRTLPDEDDRNVADLLLEQIEFADIIL